MIALFFNLDGTKAEQLSRSIAASVKFIDTRMRADDKVAILVRTFGKVKVVQDFTGSEDRLKDALDHLESNPNLDAGGLITLAAGGADVRADPRESRAHLLRFGPEESFACERAIERCHIRGQCRWRSRSPATNEVF